MARLGRSYSHPVILPQPQYVQAPAGGAALLGGTVTAGAANAGALTGT
jgi:hypothetical protein